MTNGFCNAFNNMKYDKWLSTVVHPWLNKMAMEPGRAHLITYVAAYALQLIHAMSCDIGLSLDVHLTTMR